MLRSPIDYLWVRLEKTFQDEIQTESGVKLFKDTTLNPEWATTVTGIVVGIPDKITKDPEKLQFKPDLKGFIPEAGVGTELIFSYQVVNDCELRDRDTPIFKNRFYYNGEFLWKVDYQFVLGYIRDGKIVPASGYVFLEAIEEEPELKSSILVLNQDMSGKSTLKKAKNKAKVVSVGKNRTHEPILGIKEGDTIRYDERFGMKYEINVGDKTHNIIILQQSKIVGKEV